MKNYFIPNFSNFFRLVILLFVWSAISVNGLTVEVEDIDVNTRITPGFGERTHRQARSPSESWLQVAARISTDASESEWLDEMTVNWHVMLEGGETPRLYFQTTTEYIDIKDGDDNYAVVYLRPAMIDRYFGGRRTPGARNTVVYVEVLVDNVPVANGNYNPGRIRVPDDWWRSPRLNRVERSLLSPDKTPFQWLDYEFYMTLKID